MKYIKYTEEAIEAIAQKAYEEAKAKYSQDAVACHDRKAEDIKAENTPVINFSEDAWKKANALVDLCDKEIAWHGYVERSVANPLKFLITDILVPPQVVTGTTVDSDSNEWALWASQLSDDEFSHMRCHMHSHVNMGVFSSGTDDDYQKDMVTKNGNLDYYIFLIFNKKGDVFARVYDCENNVMYDNNEVTVYGFEDPYYNWAQDEIDQQVQKKTYATAYTPSYSQHQAGIKQIVLDKDEDGFSYYGMPRSWWND